MEFPQTYRELKACCGWVCLALIAYTALTQVTTALVLAPYYLGMEELFFQDWYYYLTDAMVFYPAGFLVFGLMLRRFPTPKIRKSPPPKAGQVLSCVGVALGLLYASSLLTQMLLADTDTVDYANESVAQEPLLYAILATVILAPLCEELIFRYFLLDRLLFWGDTTAVVISALFFGLFHTNLYQFFYATAVGLVLGYVRIMTGRLSWCIGLHLFINAYCGVLPTYLPAMEWLDMLLGLIILASMVYALAYLVSIRPWRNFYPGPLQGFSPGTKARAWLTNVTFWICVLLHLGLSVYYISL